MKTLIKTILISLVLIAQINAQRTIEAPMCLNPDFNKKVNSYLNYNVPTVSVAHLADIQNDVLILDAREYKEYEISHIPTAQYIGYKKLQKDVLAEVPKDQTIVLYCSIGYRSEKIGEKLQKMGFTKVYNLYGSIFEWVNQGHTVLDLNGESTQRVHTYNRKWSKWVDAEIEKVY